jgi:TolB-like protein
LPYLFQILLIAGVLLYTKYFKEQKNEAEKSVAVLPFIKISNDPQQEF